MKILTKKHLTIAIPLATVIIIAGVWLSSTTVKSTQISSWVSSTPLPKALSDARMIQHSDALYVIGGRSASNSPLDTVWRSKLDEKGELTGWSAMTKLPAPLFYHQVATAGEDIFVSGGWDGTKARAEIWHSTFHADGTIGVWSQVSTYGQALDLHGAIIVNNYLYIIGGWTGSDALNTVGYAPISSGNLGGWQSTSSLPVKLYRFSVSSYNNYIYLTGGVTDKNALNTDVYYTKPNPDGTLATWNKTKPLLEPRNLHASVVHDGRLVILGGLSGLNAGTEQTSVFAASIATDGSLGTWNQEPPLPQALHGLAATALQKYGSDFIYTAGGRQNSTYIDQVYHSAVPPTPVPTFTDTPTLTPIPTAGIKIIRLSNAPQGELLGGDEVTYTIELENGTFPLGNVVVTNTVPDQLQLITNSVKAPTGWTTDVTKQTVKWLLPTMAANETAELVYRAQRPTFTPTPTPTDTLVPTEPTVTPTLSPTTTEPLGSDTPTLTPTLTTAASPTPSASTPLATPTPSSAVTTPTASPSATATATPTAASSNLIITKLGPSSVSAGAEIVYTLRVMNLLPTTLTGLTIFDLVPIGAEIVDFGGGSTTMPPAQMIQWQVAFMNPGSSVTRTFTILPNVGMTQIRNELYFVDVTENGKLVMRAVGQTPTVTEIIAARSIEQAAQLGIDTSLTTDPPIINEGALVEWAYSEVKRQQRSNRVGNPYQFYLLYFPLASK